MCKESKKQSAVGVSTIALSAPNPRAATADIRSAGEVWGIFTKYPDEANIRIAAYDWTGVTVPM